jgi:subtilisin family serine protease
MKLLSLLVTAAIALASTRVPDKWIVELDNDAPPSQTLRRAYSQLKSLGAQYTIDHEYDEEDLLVGFSLKIAPEQVHFLEQLDNVVKIHPVHVNKLHQDKFQVVGPEHWAKVQRYDNETSFYRRAVQSQSLSPPGIDYAPLKQTNVPALRKAGLTGKGIRVAVLDMGIDYSHPALGGCFGKGCKVAYGWDFATNSRPQIKNLW